MNSRGITPRWLPRKHKKPNKFTWNGAKSGFFRKLGLFRHICDIFSLERTMKFMKNFLSSLAAYITQTQFTNLTTANKVVHHNSTNKILSFSRKRQSSYHIPTDFHPKIILPYVQELPHLPRLLPPNFPPLSTFFLSFWLYFHEHSRFTGQQGKGEPISLTCLYYFQPLQRHLDISWEIIAEKNSWQPDSNWEREVPERK